ncbi:hypothetical protein Saro_3205 [Novosphingobium aromaticivorans DSM 12444]|uniref:Uncharacterized protein n=1 Tax=Novosphingobium aromaticivorans (strain ATCC 700278 / DSM 12444 / CCUG 56034 / CIP 105152 / NBRC 16084 / F199) TaxID=279238 RepID=Q2G3D3_NOVAD|nr:hypothetical protein [Novosphingobium aromaticivorans]ABD27640.1 hypothetical protein Saro_3205 [Novosphingobium aromaticivorans DSM 12444]SCY31787.1 hypothetical protein SAMN05660666_01406 [Novosphingobium aromaticivorans]
MGFEMRDSFVRREECKAAWESEVEFAEMARVVKALAAELGHDADTALGALARHGLGAALGVLADQAGGVDVEAGYLRRRAQSRVAASRLQ